MEKISVKTNKRVELVDITDKVKTFVTRSKISSGVCIVFCPHTTAGLTINENADPAVQSDMINIMNKLVPVSSDYTHGEGNSDSHTKSSLFGSSLNIIVEKGALALGYWQGIYFCESDGPRAREIWVKVLGDK